MMDKVTVSIEYCRCYESYNGWLGMKVLCKKAKNWYEENDTLYFGIKDCGSFGYSAGLNRDDKPSIVGQMFNKRFE